MNKSLLILAITFGLNQSIKAQLTCVPCDQLGMVMNVGSQETAISSAVSSAVSPFCLPVPSLLVC